MKGTPWKRVHGRVIKGPTYTRFRVEVTINNGCGLYEVCVLKNSDLVRFPKLYARTLDAMVVTLANRVGDRAQ